MAGAESQAEMVLDKCKIEAKRLVGYSTAVRRLHWSHSCVVSFCAAVEEVVSFGVKKKYQSSFTLMGTPQPPSVRILRTLALNKQNELAVGLWQKAALESHKLRESNEAEGGGTERRSVYTAQLVLEEKILWVKVALVEKVLLDYINLIISQWRTFYTKDSVMGDPMHADIFRNLLAGPMVIRVSKIKSADSFFISPSPHELVHRHGAFDKKKTGVAAGHTAKLSDEMDMWSHVKSLYQNPTATCLYGKNNILMKLANSTYPKFSPGYLSLHKQERGGGLELKWIPIDLLNCNQEDPEAEPAIRESLKYVLTLNIDRQVAHIHCHRTPDNQYFMIMVGYDGIASSPLIFHHQSALLNLLESMDSGLLPQGCLEPPVWFLKKQVGVSPLDGPEGEELREPWNQVFHIRTVHKQIQEEPLLPPSVRMALMTEEELESIRKIGMQDWKSGPLPSTTGEADREEHQEERPHISALLKAKRAINEERLVDFQSRVSRPLLARYFYSWLSYRRHMSKARRRVSHMVKPDVCPPKPAEQAHPLSRVQWEAAKYTTDPLLRREMYKRIYFGGIEHKLRPEVWPYILEVYPHGCSDEEKMAQDKKDRHRYQELCTSWQRIEAVHSQLRDLLERRAAELAWEHTDSGGDCADNNPLNGFESMYGTTVCVRHGEVGGEQTSDGQPTSGGTSGKERNGFTLGRKESPGNSISSGGASPVKGSSQDNNMLDGCEDDEEKALAKHFGHSSEDDATITIELTQESEGKDRCKEEHSFEAEVSAIMVQLPDELQAVLRTEDGHEWNYRKFFELPVVQYLSTQLLNIDKDVRRCDREYPFFQVDANLLTVRNLVATYCWTHRELGGYVQGMCDILAPLLVVLEDESLVYQCYVQQMERIQYHFPPNQGVSEKLANLRALVEVLEPEFFQHLAQQSCGQDFLFTYRWFLLDFKREFRYEDIYQIWETIWVANVCATPFFQEFFALALIKHYMAVILTHHMDANDMLQLFNDMASKTHEGITDTILSQAQTTIHEVYASFVRKD